MGNDDHGRTSEWPPPIPRPPRRERLRHPTRIVVDRQRTFTALTLTVVNSLLLLAWTEAQYRWLMIYGLPIVSDTRDGLNSYFNMPGLSRNVPEFSLIITILGSLLLVGAAWNFTKGASGRWRMLFCVGLCATIALSFSAAAVRWEEVHFDHLSAQRAWHQERAEKVQDEDSWHRFSERRLGERIGRYLRNRHGRSASTTRIGEKNDVPK